MKINEKDLELLIHNIILDQELNNSDLICNTTRESIINMIILLYQEINVIKNMDELKELVHTLLDRRIIIDCPEYSVEELSKINNIIDHLKTIPQPAQRTEEWYEFRNNRLTASDLATAIDKNPYSTRNKLILNKCGVKEEWNPGAAIIHGQKYEDVAVAIYESRNDVNVKEYGCLPHPTIKCFGASPDGIVDSNSKNKNYVGRMLEIKCPTKRNITGFIPKYYYYQVQGQLEVCDLEYCDFLECKISEYSTSEEYFKDGDFDYTRNSMEKGIVIELYNYELEKLTYLYGDLGISYDEFIKWENETIDNVLKDDNLDYIQTSFWKLDEYNCLLIKRDKTFWNNIEPKIIDFWNDVLKYREKGHEELLPNKKRCIAKKKDDLIFLDDSD